jgi:hypothetical protein
MASKVDKDMRRRWERKTRTGRKRAKWISVVSAAGE